MQVHHSINDLPKFKNAVVTIGSFDGIHIGHQKLISKIKQLASEINGESVLITFDPHPRKVLFPKDNSLQLLTSLDERLELFRKFGIQHVVVMPFTVEFSQLHPREYIEKFLLEKFSPKYIVIGYDHRFGLNRQGDVRLLKSYEVEHDFSVIEIQKQELDDMTISSTKIRKAIRNNEMLKAMNFLNYPYMISGEVIHGEKFGEKLGYKTANIRIDDTDKLLPSNGIYAVNVYVDGEAFEGMLYIGNKPTMHEDFKRSIEVNIFDFNQNIYGKKIRLEILAFIRNDKKFESLEDLKQGIAQDEISSKFVIKKLKSKQKARIAIAVLNYNGEEILETYLPTTIGSSKNLVNYYLIDNKSTDESVEYVKEWQPEYKLIELQKNYGFTGGYNKGLQNINEEFIVILNSDIKCTDNWLDPIIKLMDTDKSIAAVQPKILSVEEPQKFEYAGASGGYIDRWGYPFCRGRLFGDIEEDNNQYDDIIEVAWASGAAMVVRNEVFKNFGGFDEDYFAHQEEIDFCWRVKNAGYKIMVQPKSIVYHLGGGTLSYESPRKTYLNFRNNLVTILKNDQNNVWMTFVWRLLLDGVAAVKFLVDGHLQNAMSIARAHWSVFPKLGQILTKRKKIKKLTNELRIDSSNHKGMVDYSIVYQYFVNGKKVFRDLEK